MDESISVITGDGVEHDLDTCTERGVDGIAGMVRIPEKRGKNLVIPGRHGELHIPAKKYGASTIVANLWVRGARPDGTIPEDEAGRIQFLTNLRTLLGLFVEDELVTLRHTLSDGTAREIVGEVTDVIEPELSGFGRYQVATMAVTLNCASPFWTDLTPTTATFTVPSGTSVTLAEFAGISAPVEDLLIVFGQSNNPRLTQPSTGVFVQVGRALTSGQTVTVDTAQFEVYGSPGVASGLYEDLSYGGRATSRWFALLPEPGGAAPVVAFNHAGGGSRTCSITGKRTHKIG